MTGVGLGLAVGVRLGVGVMPLRAFMLMHNAGELAAVPLTDSWAHRRIELVARDFSTLPRSARLLVALPWGCAAS